MHICPRREIAAVENGADYSGQQPNCNVALPYGIRPDSALFRRACSRREASVWVRRNRLHAMAKRVKKPPAKTSSPRPKTAAANGSDAVLERIAVALERLAGGAPTAPQLAAADAFSWHPDGHRLAPLPGSIASRCRCSRASTARDVLVENTERCPWPAGQQRAAWGKRAAWQVVAGQGGACVDQRRARRAQGKAGNGLLKLVEIHREDIESLPELMALMRDTPYRFIVFCDDLSFEAEDTSYKAPRRCWKAASRPAGQHGVLRHSNRRHLMARDMMENERSTAINPGEAVEEKVSLSDRFGLWLGFHRCSQDEIPAMVDGHVAHYGITHPREQLHRKRWNGRPPSARSPRGLAIVQDLAGRLGVRLSGVAVSSQDAKARFFPDS
jgi:predicted AAA+ superfamily ATPase